MKLHLPLPLRSALLAVCAVGIVTPVAAADDDEQDASDSLNIESIAQMLRSVSELERTSAAEATDLYWGAGQTGGSVILGRDGSFWSTQSGMSGTEEWEDDKNVHLEARGGTITVTASTLLMKSLTFAPSSATYNFILPTSFLLGPGEPSLLSVGKGTTLCLQGNGSLMVMYGTGVMDGSSICQVEGSLKIEEGVSVRMNIAKAEINSLTLTNGYLVVGEGTIQNLQGTCESIQFGPYEAGLEAGNTLTIVDGEYTGKLKTDWGGLIIEGKFRYDTPGTDEEEKYKNRATVAALTVNSQFTLNGVMETPTLDGKGSIIGEGTLQFGNGSSEFDGEVGVNITCNGNEASTVTLSHYTGKNVTLNNGGTLTLSNKESDIQLTALHVDGKLEVKEGKLIMETPALDGGGSIIGKGTLQFGNGSSEFNGEVGVNIICNGNEASTVTLSHYTGKNVTLNNGGTLTLPNKGSDIQLTTLHIGGKLEVKEGKLRVEESITWDLGSLHFFSSGQSVVFVGNGWNEKLDKTNGKLTITLKENVLGISEFGDIILLDWAGQGNDFDFRDYFEISLDGDRERYENLTLRADGHVTWGGSDDLYWGSERTSNSIVLGEDQRVWSFLPGKSGTAAWQDDKNVHLEAKSGTIAVTSSGYRSMKSLTIAPGSATYNFDLDCRVGEPIDPNSPAESLPTILFVGDGTTLYVGNGRELAVNGSLTVGAGATLCIGEGSMMNVYGSYSGEGSLQVEKNGRLSIMGKSTVKSLTVTDGSLMLGEDSSVENLQGTCESIRFGPYEAGIEAKKALTIVDGEYTGKLKVDQGKLTIDGKFKYDTPGTEEEEKYKNRATVAALTVNKQFTLNGVMETRSTLDGKGSIIGKGTLQFGEGSSEFNGEVGVNIICNGSGSTVTLSHYTGKNVMLNNGGTLTLSNKGLNIQLETLHIGGNLEVKVGKLRLVESITWDAALGSLHFYSFRQSVIFTEGVRWDKELAETNGKLTIILEKNVLGVGSSGDITLLDWSLRRDDFDFRDYFEISFDGDRERYENLTLRADGHVVWGKKVPSGHGGSGDSEDSDSLYWGAKQTSGSVTLGGNSGSWSTKSGEAGNEVWKDDKNVHLEATGGTITVKEDSSPSMKSLTIVAGSAIYNIISDGSTKANVDGNLTVGAGATLCMGEGSVLQVNGSYSGDGILKVENGGALTISGQATIKKATVEDGVLSLGSGSSISDLQGDPVNWKPNHGIQGQGNLTIESGNYTGSLKTDELTIAGNFTYGTPGANGGEKLENAAAVGGLTVDGKLTLNGGMLATSLRGKGSIIGQGTLQLANSENNSFEGEVGVNLLYAGSSFTLSKYTGKSVTVTSGQLTLANEGNGIKLETLTFRGSSTLVVKDAGSSVSGNVTLGKNQQLTLASGASLSVGSLTLSGGTLDVSGALGKLNAGALKTTATTTLNVGNLYAMAAGSYSILSYDSHDGADVNQLKLQVGSVGARKSFRLEVQQNALMLVVTGKGANLTWNNISTKTWGAGTVGGEWDAAQTVLDKHFFNGDNVTFNGAGEVNIQGEVEPGSITVQGNEATTFMSNDDTGSIAGAAQLTKKDEGKLTINTVNAYTGGTVVEGGELVTGNAKALGEGNVTVKSGVLDMDSAALANELHIVGTAEVKNGGSYVGKLTLDGGTLDGAVNLAQDAELKNGTVAGVLSGKGGVVVSGGGVTLSGANTYTGKTTVQSGTLTVSGSVASKQIEVQSGGTYSGTLAGPDLTVTLAGGTLKGDVTLDGSVALNSTATGSTVDGRLNLAQGGKLGVTEGAGLSVKELVADGGELSLATDNSGHLSVGTFSTTSNKTTLNVDDDLLGLEDGTYELLTYETLGSGSSADALELAGLSDLHTRKDYSLGLGANSLTLSVSGGSEDLIWDPASTNTWSNENAGGEWSGKAEDKRFYDGDSVTFDSAGDVPIEGAVNPASITVKGDSDTTFKNAADKAGALTGNATLTKEGAGTLDIQTDNSAYSGNIEVKGGTLRVGHDHALGSGDVNIANAKFDGAGHAVNNKVTLSGNSQLKDASGVTNLTFANGSKITGEDGYTLSVGHTLTIDSTGKARSAENPGSSYSGAFTFAGGTLKLNGGAFDLSGATVNFADGSKSTIDLSGWEGMTYGNEYTLAKLQLGEGNEAFTEYFEVTMDPQMQSSAHIEVRENGEVVLVMMEDPTVAATLTRDQAAAYSVLAQIASNQLATGTLAEAAYLATTGNPEIIDQLSGAEIATAISSQMEGNLAHLRRLRTTIGSGQTLSSESSLAAFISAYDDFTSMQRDYNGRGYNRTEYGGVFGMETRLEKDTLLGLALSAGRARVAPSGAQERYHEDTYRQDLYLVTNIADGLRSTTTVGVGEHKFSMHRAGYGLVSSARDMKGNSLNFSEEIAVTLSSGETGSFETFFSLESTYSHIKAFHESGAGTASISADAHEAWATDLSLGVRANLSFTLMGDVPAAMLSMQAALVSSVGDTGTDVTMRYAGAPDLPYNVRAAKRNRWGYSLGTSLTVPVSKETAIIGSAETVLRGDSHETTGSVGIRMSF